MDISVIKSTDSLALKTLNALVSDAFGYQTPHTFFDDFPIWGSDLPEVVRLAIYDGAKLISHVGIRYCEMQTSKGLVPIALVGAVATEAAHRGKGYSTALLKEALKRIDEKNCLWTLLWGSEHEFYKKFGFHLQGEQTRAAVSSLALPKNVNLSATVKTGLTEKIFQEILKESRGITLGEKDRAWVFAHKTIQWFSTETPFAFVGFERGMDLHHMIHEFGGETSAIQALFYKTFEKDAAAEVMGKAHALEKLGFAPSDLTREYLCLARPLHATEHWNDEFWVAGLSAC